MLVSQVGGRCHAFYFALGSVLLACTNPIAAESSGGKGPSSPTPAAAVAPGDAFARAIHTDSTASLYVLVTIVDLNSGKRLLTATDAHFLLGAIHREHRLGYDAASIEIAKEMALKSPDRVFAFRNRDALKNVRPGYDLATLTEMRGTLARYTNDQIRNQWSSIVPPLYEAHEQDQRWDEYADAIAHVLLERGMQVGMHSCWGQLFLESQNP